MACQTQTGVFFETPCIAACPGRVHHWQKSRPGAQLHRGADSRGARGDAQTYRDARP